MSEKIISDAGAGRALFLTRIKLTAHAISMALWAGALPGLIIPFVLWLACLSPKDVDLVKENLVSHMVSETTARKWKVRDEAGEVKVLTVVKSDGGEVQLLTPSQFRVVTLPLSRPVRVFGYVVWSAVVLAVLGYIVVWRSLAKLGKNARENKRIDGAKDLVKPQELSTLVKREEPGDYRLLDVLLPRSAPMQGIIFQGAQGTGKSLGQHDLMQQVFARKRKAIIYDPSGEYFRAYYRPGKDFFFNPALLGSVPWSI